MRLQHVVFALKGKILSDLAGLVAFSFCLILHENYQVYALYSVDKNIQI